MRVYVFSTEERRPVFCRTKFTNYGIVIMPLLLRGSCRRPTTIWRNSPCWPISTKTRFHCRKSHSRDPTAVRAAGRNWWPLMATKDESCARQNTNNNKKKEHEIGLMIPRARGSRVRVKAWRWKDGPYGQPKATPVKWNAVSAPTPIAFGLAIFQLS